MKYLDSHDLRKLQLIDLYILLEVKRICDLHNIQYFLIGGTLLGAVRHRGFIPWDDDIDIGMLRNDYQKFIEICKTELNPRFHLQTKETDKLYPNPWAKIRLKNTARMEEGLMYSNIDAYGIDIDIFPFDNLPTNPITQWYTSSMFKLFWSLYRHRCGFNNSTKSRLKNVILAIYKLIYLFISEQQLSATIDKLMRRYNHKVTKYVINYAGAYSYKRERTEKTIVSQHTQVEFEGYYFPAPLKYNEYLRNVYGNDFMLIPKKEKRIQHQIYHLDFGEYKDIDKISLNKLQKTFLKQ